MKWKHEYKSVHVLVMLHASFPSIYSSLLSQVGWILMLRWLR